jgi:hypothetical protein
VGGWIGFGAVVVVAGIGLLALFRSLRKWKQPPATSHAAKVAEDDLFWMTHRNMPG